MKKLITTAVLILTIGIIACGSDDNNGKTYLYLYEIWEEKETLTNGIEIELRIEFWQETKGVTDKQMDDVIEIFQTMYTNGNPKMKETLSENLTEIHIADRVEIRHQGKVLFVGKDDTHATIGIYLLNNGIIQVAK